MQQCFISEIDSTLANYKKNFPNILLGDSIVFRGAPPTRNKYHLGIVGSRRPNPESRIILSEMLSALANENLRIISGGALGVDAQAHFYALKNLIPTYSWVVGDPDKPTPHANRQIFDAIAVRPECSIITPKCLFHKNNFGLYPQHWIERNFWLCANSDALLVVQAKEKSGTWWTVKAAQEFDIPVYVLSGSLVDPCYAGNNAMISKCYGTPVNSLSEFVQDIRDRIKTSFEYSEKIVKEGAAILRD